MANWRSSRPIFAPKGLDLSWMLAFVPIIITITCWHQLFQITSLFNQFTSLLALNCSCPNFFWMCCRSEWQERMYIYKWHDVDQTKHEIFCVHIVCNEIQVKVNLEITTFFFYLRFPYCPNFFWFGVVCQRVLVWNGHKCMTVWVIVILRASCWLDTQHKHNEYNKEALHSTSTSTISISYVQQTQYSPSLW